MTTLSRHFVEFYSPGTFVSESTVKEIDSWDVDVAVKMAREIVERYNARPYGFRFVTRERGPDDLDSRVSARSGTYFLGGRIETLADVEARNDPKEETLRYNMQANNIERIIVNDNSWRFTGAFNEGDVLLDVKLDDGRPT